MLAGTPARSQSWRERRLGDVVRLKRGYDLPKRRRVPGSIPVVSSSGITDSHRKSKVRGPGVIIGRYGTLGEVHFVAGDYWPLNTTLYVEDFKGNVPRYVGYLLETIDVRPYSDKAAVPGLNRNHLHEEIITFTSSQSQQRAIAHILGSLDDKIELNRRMNETLEAMARAIFKDWFVDFGPTLAKVRNRDSGLPRHIADLFPDRLVDSEMGGIPEGWEVRPLIDLIEVNPSRALKKGQDAPYLNMANMPTQGHTPAVVVSRPFGSGMRFKNGDTLVARITPCLENGKTAYVDFLEEGQIGWGSTEYIVMRAKPPLPNEYAYFLARSRRFREFAIQNMSGTSGRQRVQAKALWLFPIVNPPKKIAEAFGTLIRSFIVRASVTDGESRSLASLRDCVLPKLMSGEIRLRKAENLEVETCTG